MGSRGIMTGPGKHATKEKKTKGVTTLNVFDSIAVNI